MKRRVARRGGTGDRKGISGVLHSLSGGRWCGNWRAEQRQREHPYQPHRVIVWLEMDGTRRADARRVRRTGGSDLLARPRARISMGWNVVRADPMEQVGRHLPFVWNIGPFITT